MIAKKEWFKPRILGWGLRPVKWEGWIYIAVVVLLFFGALNLPIGEIPSIIIASLIMAIFLIDTIVIMFQMYKSLDERERKQQHMIETSVSYTAVAAIILVAIYEYITVGTVEVGLWVVLGAMLLTKEIVSVYLWKKGQ